MKRKKMPSETKVLKTEIGKWQDECKRLAYLLNNPIAFHSEMTKKEKAEWDLYWEKVASGEYNYQLHYAQTMLNLLIGITYGRKDF